MSSSEEDLLVDLLSEALAVLERGDTLDLRAICHQHPELEERVASSLARLGHLPTMHRAVAEDDPMRGVVLAGRYLIEERIGSGAMGAVYRAFDRQLNRLVAVKVLRPELVVGEKLDRRLAREGEVLAGIRHGSVVTVFDRGQAEDGRAFLVMELLRGATAAQLLADEGKDSPYSTGRARLKRFQRELGDGAISADSDVRQAVAWIAAAAAGLGAAHAAGVVHRDVKPSNLFIERTGRVVVLDFGIVSLGSKLTMGADGSPLGTPSFMAPEQLDVDAEPDPRTDIYGLCATLYQLVTGTAPFVGTPQQVLAALGRSEPRPADQIRPGLPRDLVAVIEKGMDRELANRYQTADELRQDLEAWLDFRPVTARRRSPLAVATRRAVRSPFVRGMAVVVLLVAVAGAWWGWRDHHAVLAQQLREQAERDWFTLFRQVPPVLLVAPPSYRATSAVTSSTAVRKLLDRLVALEVFADTSLALRYLLRSDAGDLGGAADDLQRLTVDRPTGFCHRAVEALRDGKLPDTLLSEGMNQPEFGSRADRIVTAVTALRALARTPDWVAKSLDVADAEISGLADIAAVAVLLHGAGFEPEERTELYRDLEQHVARLDGMRGQTSAFLSHVRANMLVHFERSVEALEAAKTGRELAPDDGGLAVLAGGISIDLGDAEAGLELLQQAIILYPLSRQAHLRLFEVQIGIGDLDAAEQTLAAIPFRKSFFAGPEQLRAEALLYYAQAAQADDDADRRRLALLARKRFRRLRRTDTQREFAEIAADLLIERTPALTTELLSAWGKQPLRVDSLRQVALMLSGPLDPAQVAQLADVLRAQASELSSRGR